MKTTITRRPLWARNLSVLAILLLGATVLVACGGDDDDDSSDSGSTATSGESSGMTMGASETSNSGNGLTVDLEGMRIVDAWARPGIASDDVDMGMGMATPETDSTMGADMPGGSGVTTSAVYMTLENTTNDVRRVVAASTDVANTVELHESSMKDGLMQMAPVPYLEVPANGTLQLQPGGLHVMLIGLTGDLVAGDTLDLTLETEAGETLVLEGIPILEPGT